MILKRKHGLMVVNSPTIYHVHQVLEKTVVTSYEIFTEVRLSAYFHQQGGFQPTRWIFVIDKTPEDFLQGFVTNPF